MLKKDPEERISTSGLLRKKYFIRYKDNFDAAKKIFAQFLTTVEPEKHMERRV